MIGRNPLQRLQHLAVSALTVIRGKLAVVAPALALIRGGTILHLQSLATVVPALVVLQGEPAEVLNCALDVDIVIAAVGSCSRVTG